MLVPRVCAPRVTRCNLGRYWSRDLCSKQAAERLAGWLGIQTVILSRSDRLPRRWAQQAANPGVHRLSMTHSERQRNLMMHAQCPLPVNYSQSERTQRELSNEYQHDRFQMDFKKILVLVHWTKVALSIGRVNPVMLLKNTHMVCRLQKKSFFKHI